jgi:hypothetical protein
MRDAHVYQSRDRHGFMLAAYVLVPANDNEPPDPPPAASLRIQQHQDFADVGDRLFCGMVPVFADTA